MSISEERLSTSDLHILEIIDTLQGDDVVRALRSMVLTRLSQIERQEEMTLEVLKDSIFLASQNLQDARIADLEVRVDDLESPEPSTLYETVSDAILMLAAELVLFGIIYVGSSVAAAALGGAMMSRASAFASRRAFLDTNKVRFQNAFAVNAAKRKVLANELAEAERKLMSIQNLRLGFSRAANPNSRAAGTFFDKLTKRAEPLGLNVANLKAELKRLEAIHGSLENMQRHLETNNTIMKSVSHAFKNPIHPATLDGTGAGSMPLLKDGRLKKIVESELFKDTMTAMTGYLRSRSATKVVDSLSRQMGEGDPDNTDGTVFLTSDVLNDVLSEITFEQMEARSLADQRRTVLQIASDDEFLDGPLIHEILAEAGVMRAGSTNVELNSAVGRAALVEAAELYLWYQYLSKCNLLATSEKYAVVSVDTTHSGGTQHTTKTQTNGVHGPYQLLEDAEPEDVIEGRADVLVKATLYHGAPVLSENIADHLFRRFCMKLLKDNPYNVRIPLERDPEDYLAALKEEKTYYLGMFSTDRQQKIDEMRIIVIQTFIRIFETHQPEFDDPSQRLLGMLDVATVQAAAEDAPVPKLFPDDRELAEMKSQFADFMEKSDYKIVSLDMGLWDVRLRLRLSEIEHHIAEYEQTVALSRDDMNADLRQDLIGKASAAIAAYEQDLDEIREADDDGRFKSFIETFEAEQQERLDAISRWDPNAPQLAPGGEPGVLDDFWTTPQPPE